MSDYAPLLALIAFALLSVVISVSARRFAMRATASNARSMSEDNANAK